jgi:hypothetical protein
MEELGLAYLDSSREQEQSPFQEVGGACAVTGEGLEQGVRSALEVGGEE